jgi:ubiquinone/menaquinone biosynthesis C-methylase UbiE/uncharacterized protein YbaR (Trm112 family)
MITDILSILACPDCGADILKDESGEPTCEGCKRTFPMVDDNIFSLLPLNPKPLPDAYNDPDYLKMSAHFDEASEYFTDGNSIFNAIQGSSHQYVSGRLSGQGPADWVCDFGCGQGFFADYFQGDPTRMIGVDYRIESLRRYRARFKEPVLIQADFTRLPFKRDTVAIGVSLYALEHVYHLEDALKEMSRVVKGGSTFYVGLPCEGGLAWTLGRKLTSERTMSKRFNLDYKKYIRLEHCNTASRVVSALGRHFNIEHRSLYPLNILPIISTNLTISLTMINK